MQKRCFKSCEWLTIVTHCKPNAESAEVESKIERERESKESKKREVRQKQVKVMQNILYQKAC